MNTADKKRIEKMLRDQSYRVLGIRVGSEWGYEDPGPADPVVKAPKVLRTRLTAAFEALKPTQAEIARVEKAVQALRDKGFTVDYHKPDITKRVIQAPHVYPNETNPTLIAQKKAKAARRKAVIHATDAAIIDLWSNDDFNIAVYLERIEGAG